MHAASAAPSTWRERKAAPAATVGGDALVGRMPRLPSGAGLRRLLAATTAGDQYVNCTRTEDCVHANSCCGSCGASFGCGFVLEISPYGFSVRNER